MFYFVYPFQSVFPLFNLYLISTGDDVIIGTRNVADKLAKTETNQRAYEYPVAGTQPIRIETFTEVAQQASVLFNCTKGEVSIDVLVAAGPENPNGKRLIAIANLLNTMTAVLMVKPASLPGDHTAFVSENGEWAK